jgi:dihydrofolate reductase
VAHSRLRLDSARRHVPGQPRGQGQKVEQARAVAGVKDVLLAGGVSIAQQAWAARPVDEVGRHVPPVLVGRGKSLSGASRAGLRCVGAVQGEGALHLRYEVQ